jgi:protein-arginine kinase activator protein McsA
MKRCNKCDNDKDESEFYTRIVRGKVKEDKWCKKCHRAHRKEHYEKNKNAYLAKARTSHEKFKAWFKEYKATLKCSRCPEDHPAALDFHHVDSGTKDGAIGTLVRRKGKRWVVAEIEKCIVLCANCHRKHHWNESL